MTIEPSQPLPEPEQKPLKPGKGYGIASMLCGAVSVFPFVSICLFVFVPVAWDESTRESIVRAIIITIFISPVCAIAGYVLGTEGRDTEGQFYASIGRALSTLYALLLPLFIVLFMLTFSVV